MATSGPKQIVNSKVVDKGKGGRFQTVVTRTPNEYGGMDVQEKTFTIREPEEPSSKPQQRPVSGGGFQISAPDATLVETMLFLLIIVNGFTSGQFKGLWGLITLQAGVNPQQFRQGFLVLFGEIVALIILSLVAKSSDAANKTVLALVGALWLGWFIHNQQAIALFSAKVQPGKPVKQGGKLTTA